MRWAASLFQERERELYLSHYSNNLSSGECPFRNRERSDPHRHCRLERSKGTCWALPNNGKPP